MLKVNTQTQYLVNRYKTKKKNCVHLNSCHTKMKKYFKYTNELSSV